MPMTDAAAAAEIGKKRKKEREGGVKEEYAHLVHKYYYDKIPLEIRPLVFAAFSGDLDGLRRAFENLDGDIDERMNLLDIDDPMDKYGRTLLHLTCIKGHLTCAQFLLERGASLEIFDVHERIPLHYACLGGHTEIVQLVLAHAKEPEVVKRMLETVDEEWNTPLHLAARLAHVDVIRLLLAHGSSLTKTDVFGNTPIQCSILSEAKRVLQEAMRAASSDKTAE